MPFSICMRAGMFACLCTLVAWTPAVFSKVKTLQYEDVQQLSTIVNRALKSNPEIQAAQAAVDAAKARLVGAGLPLNNPELQLEAEQTDTSTYSVGISQAIDWHNKRGAFEQAARVALAAAHAYLEALRLAKGAELLDAIGRVVSENEIKSFSKHRTEILERFAHLAKQRYNAGDISKAELELARLSLAEAIMQHAENGAGLIQAKADYFSISGRLLDNSYKLPGPLPTVLPSEQDEEVLTRNHPLVQAAHQATLAARQQIYAADKERKADPTFGLAAGRDDNENLVALSFSIPLQVRNNFSSSVDAAQAEALQAEQEAHQVYRNVQARFNSARERYKLVVDAWTHWDSQGRISLQQRTKFLEALWQSGEMSTTEYLLQVQQTLDTQIAGIKLYSNLWSTWVEWLNATGTLSAWLNNTSKEQ